MPLEITFAPTRLNIHEAEDVIYAAMEFGAFRFNTGGLMRLGTAAKLWDKLEPSSADYEKFLKLLCDKEAEIGGRMELAFRPFWFQNDMVSAIKEPPGTLLVLPNGKVKVTAGLPFVCGDLKQQSLAEVWDGYRAAWKDPRVARELKLLAADNSYLAQTDRFVELNGSESEPRFGRVFPDHEGDAVRSAAPFR
jgi:MoaA/NifB/PqqE/SkfB family radical SAM enzyme